MKSEKEKPKRQHVGLEIGDSGGMGQPDMGRKPDTKLISARFEGPLRPHIG